jgi:hypothetical protein
LADKNTMEARMTAVATQLALHVATASAGVDYSHRHGATCPGCGERARIVKTLPWEGSTRIRYHRCENTRCLLCAARATIKSVEEDFSG